MLYFNLIEVLQQLRDFFNTISGIEEVYLFGATIRGEFLPESDLDLLILAKNPSKVSSIVNSFLDEVFIKQGILISALFEDIYNRSIISSQLPREGQLIWAKQRNS